ncbi:MAG: hypothetical protein F9K18_09140, partial [Thermoanaerobaculia bacterium]
MSVDRRLHASSLLALAIAGVTTLEGQVVPQRASELDRLEVAAERLEPPARNVPWSAHADTLAPALVAAWDRFRAAAGGSWQADLDPRNGRVGFVEGSGLPWIPGHGNALTLDRVAAPL